MTANTKFLLQGFLLLVLLPVCVLLACWLVVVARGG
jgi:hypothetical protein